ncbi:MAG: glutamine amidotransferase [Acidiferrobacteraceae bacterium]|nr:glutamine amidotransferase [Acidiferrobacteraceae bacterium]
MPVGKNACKGRREGVPRRAVLIVHGEDRPGDGDRASARLGELGYQLDWRHPDAGDELPESDESVAVTVIYGGGKPEDEKDWHTDRYPWLHNEIRWAEHCIAKNIPTVGFCLGGQIIAHALGATIGPHPDGLYEFGYYLLRLTESGQGFFPQNIHGTECHYHGFSVPDGATLLAETEHYPQAFRYGETTYGFQFHPECTLENFARWQAKDRSVYDRPGVQSRQQQDRLGADYDHLQAAWLQRFLTELLGVDQ